ncbi:MAG: hypothetical protein AB1664_08045 [Thermodesulfobacteriota bacterium]
MKVSIKDLAVTMGLGNKGLELDVYDSRGKHLGDLCIGKASIEWCKGKTRRGNGTKKTWAELIRFFDPGHH